MEIHVVHHYMSADVRDMTFMRKSPKNIHMNRKDSDGDIESDFFYFSEFESIFLFYWVEWIIFYLEVLFFLFFSPILVKKMSEL